MPLKPNIFERLMLLDSNLGPGPLLDLFGVLAFKAVLAALRLGVFEVLRDGPQHPDELARRLEVDGRAARFLLDALEGLGYVRRKGDGRFLNAAAARRWLLEGESGRLGEIFGFFDDMQHRWDYLDQTIRAGRPPRTAAQWLDAHGGAWGRYHAGLRAVSRLLAPEIVSRVRIPAGARRLLDLGGGHGFYSVSFCRRHPHLTATVLDWAQARPAAEQTLAVEGMADRIRFLEGDLREELPGGQDLVLLFNVLRILHAADAVALVRRAREALRPGGLAVVMDNFRRPRGTRLQAATAALIALEICNAGRGAVHPEEEVSRWLEEAGFSRPRRIPLKRSPGLVLLCATRL